MARKDLGRYALEPDAITIEEYRRLTAATPAPLPPRRPIPPGKPGRICTLEGCRRPHEARGMCGMHYRRWRKGQAAASSSTITDRP